MWNREDWYSVTDASEKLADSIFRVHIQDSDNYILIYIVQGWKAWLFTNTAVRISRYTSPEVLCYCH